jgi:hypothetical protein
MIFKKYDVFISYAIEDKLTVAEPMSDALKKSGLKVFFAGTQLGIGDDIREVIHTGLRQSKYGVVILSPNYNRSWTLGELFNLFDKEVFEKHAVIFPVWHNIRFSEIKSHFPDLVNRYALPTDYGLDFITTEITKQVKRRKVKKRKRYLLRFSALFLLMSLSTMLVPGVERIRQNKARNNKVFETLIKNKIHERKLEIENYFKDQKNENRGMLSTPDTVIAKYRQYLKQGNGGYHYYSFKSGIKPKLTNKKAIQNARIMVSENPSAYHGLEDPYAYRFKETTLRKDTVFYADYGMVSQSDMSFTIDSSWKDREERQHIYVKYSNNIAAVRVKYIIWKNSKPRRKQYVDLFGFMPREEYIMSNSNGQWLIEEIK